MTRISGIVAVTILAWVSATAQVTDICDPEIVQMVREVSADSLHAVIERLVGFGTRHTLSKSTDGARGIGAAREWDTRAIQRVGEEFRRTLHRNDRHNVGSPGREAYQRPRPHRKRRRHAEGYRPRGQPCVRDQRSH